MVGGATSVDAGRPHLDRRRDAERALSRATRWPSRSSRPLQPGLDPSAGAPTRRGVGCAGPTSVRNFAGARLAAEPDLAERLVPGASPAQAGRLLTTYARSGAHPAFHGRLDAHLTALCVRHHDTLALPAIDVATHLEAPAPLIDALRQLTTNPATPRGAAGRLRTDRPGPAVVRAPRRHPRRVHRARHFALLGVPLRSVSPGAKYPQAPAVPADVAPRPQTIVRRDTHVDSAFPQDRRVTPPVSAPASRARGFALWSGSADRLRPGLHPRPEPRSPIRRPGRGRLRAGVCREGRRQARPAARA